MDFNERIFELFGNRLSELEYMFGFNDIVSEKIDYVMLDLLDLSLGLSVQFVDENFEFVMLVGMFDVEIERENVIDI